MGVPSARFRIIWRALRQVTTHLLMPENHTKRLGSALQFKPENGYIAMVSFPQNTMSLRNAKPIQRKERRNCRCAIMKLDRLYSRDRKDPEQIAN
jgi:hypothetical protein